MKNKFLLLTWFFSLFPCLVLGQSADKIMDQVLSHPKPQSSISEISLEIERTKRGKVKTKIREFTRFKKNYQSGKYKSKSLVRFKKPLTVKGTGLLSWVQKDGITDNWFFLPKLKTAKRVKGKDRSKSFMGTDFIYEDLESRSIGMDSLSLLGVEYLEGNHCHIIMAWPKDESYYHSRKIWVNSQLQQIVKIEFYTSETELEKTLFISNFIEEKGFVSPGKMVIEKGENKKTIMTINSFKPNAGLKDEIFSESFLIKI